MTTSDIALLPPKDTALQVFSQDKGLDPYLAKIKQELDSFVPDVSTKKGRDAIASIAHKVARSKTALDTVGKDLVAELKDVPRKIDAERKRMRDLLDAWKDDVRRPLTEWEEKEESRQAKHRTAVEMIENLGQGLQEMTAGSLRETIAALSCSTVDEGFEEYEAQAHQAKARTMGLLEAALVAREKHEAEQREMARLREEAAKREQKEREERIAREATERAEREAAARAQAEREAVIRREEETKAAADRRELELKLAAERAEREKTEAVQREQQAKADAERREKDAIEAERRRVEAEAQREAEETRQREANKAHLRKINQAALAAFVAGGLTEDQAKLAIQLIAKRAIPAVSISY